MPPRKAGPASSPVSPPSVKLTSSMKKRILPAFIIENAVKKVRFEGLIEPENEDDIDTDVEACEAAEAGEPKTVADTLLEKMEDLVERLNVMEETIMTMLRARAYLEDEIKARNLTQRLDSGEVISEDEIREYGSDEDGCPDEFDISISDVTLEVSIDDFFMFIWGNVEEEVIFRMIGPGPSEVTRETAQYYLRSDPIVLLEVLEMALEQAQAKIDAIEASVQLGTASA